MHGGPHGLPEERGTKSCGVAIVQGPRSPPSEMIRQKFLVCVLKKVFDFFMINWFNREWVSHPGNFKYHKHCGYCDMECNSA